MLASAVDHLVHYVVAAAADYDAAEDALSGAYLADPTSAACEAAARTAKRRAAELAIAIDGLADRCDGESGLSKASVRSCVSALCAWPGTCQRRIGCLERVRAIANAYKHEVVHDKGLPVASDRDVLVVALGYGIDGFGVGKFGGCLEVIVRDRKGELWKFLGDAPVAISAWFRFLGTRGARLPGSTYYVCGLQVHP